MRDEERVLLVGGNGEAVREADRRLTAAGFLVEATTRAHPLSPGGCAAVLVWARPDEAKTRVREIATAAPGAAVLAVFPQPDDEAMTGAFLAGADDCMLAEQIERDGVLARIVRRAILRRRASPLHARLAALSERCPNPIADWDARTGSFYCNDAARLHFPELEREGPAHEVLRGVGALAEALSQSGTSVRREVRFGPRWYEQKVVRDRDGPIRIYMSDVTALKESERSFRESEARFRSLFHAAGSAILFLSPTLEIIEFNREAEQLHGIGRADARGRYYPDLLAARDSSRRFESAARDVLAAGETEDFECEVEAPGGSPRVLHWSMRPLAAAEGGIAGILAVGHDVTERKEAERGLHDSERKLQALFHESLDVLLVLDAETGNILRANRSARRLLGHGPDELFGRHVSVLFPEQAPRPADEVIGEIRASGEVFESQRFRRADGSLCTMDLTATMIPWGTGRAILAVLRDATVREEALAALRESEERYALAARGANDGLWDYDLRERRVYYGPRWKTMLGCEEKEIGDSPEEWFGRVHPEDAETLRVAVENHLQGLTEWLEAEYRMRTKPGEYRWMLCRGLAIREKGEPVRMAGSQTDISERKHLEERLRKRVFLDSLTGLANRELFLDRLQTRFEQGRARSEGFAVAIVDPDRFKMANDAYGHDAGDAVLRTIGERLLDAARPADTVARLGGDIFAVLFPDTADATDAARRLEQILASFDAPFPVRGGEEVILAATGGLALAMPTYDRAEDLLRDAQTALYRAKAAARGGYVLFDPQMHERAVRLVRMETDLRRAVQRGELEVHYQPIVALKEGVVAGFEALVRWRRSDGKLVPPNDFIPLAEETGIVVQIGAHVMEQACRQLSEWRRRYPAPIHVSVNVSSVEFARGDLLARVGRVLDRFAPPAGSFHVEITESLFMRDDEGTTRTIEAIRRLGSRLYLDDFGTGYSSLSCLDRFPVDVLKIDRSFVSRLDAGSGRADIVRTIVDLAHGLEMQVVAEGIETAEQLARLREMGCDFGQGYFFSKPVPAEEAEKLLATDARW